MIKMSYIREVKALKKIRLKARCFTAGTNSHKEKRG